MHGVAVAGPGQPWVRDVTRDAVRHFAWGVGDNNPLWLDPDYAQHSRWGDIIAPPCFAYAVHETTVAPGHDDRQRIYQRVDWQWFDVARLGTQMTATAELIDTQSSADVITQTGRVGFRDGSNALLAQATTACQRPITHRVWSSERADRRYPDEELAAIEQAILCESRRGTALRYWEDTVTGEALQPLTKGPLSIMDIVAWSAGALGVPALDDAVSDGGLIDEVATGPQLGAWFAHLVTDWAGDDGFLLRLSVTFAALPSLGTTTILRGKVTHRSTLNGLCAVDVYLTAINSDDQVLATATAAVALASRAHGPVPLPISIPTDSARQPWNSA